MPQPLKPQPLWIRVDENRLKLVVFAAVFVVGSALLLAMAFVGVPGVLIGGALVVLEAAAPSEVTRTLILIFSGALALLLVIGAIASAVQLTNAVDWVRSRFNADELAQGAHPAFNRAVGDMALAAGISVAPRVLVVESESVNAGVVGLSRTDVTLVVTQGLLERFDEGELQAVLATLMARVVSGDVLYGTALAALMGPLKALRDWRQGASVVDTVMSDGCAADGCGCLTEALFDADSPGGCAAGLLTVLFGAVVVTLTYAAVVAAAWIVTVWGRLLHRTSYEKADAEGMLLLKDPEPMLTALRTAITSSNQMADGDASYDGVFYASTSGTSA
ncbi:MAG: M48 family metalloprotease, partial [Coriobacteriia bacterium]|nr:M48 family metalloprotease [Coriobacteriia bacterium]